MIPFRSVAARLSVYVAIAQVAGYVVTHVGVHILGAFGVIPGGPEYWNDLAFPKIHALAAASVTRVPDGILRLDPTPELRASMELMPSLRIAVIDPRTAAELPGSSPELVSRIKAKDGVRPISLSYRIDGAPGTDFKGALVLTNTRHGSLEIATYGYVSSWRDFPYWMYVAGLGDIRYHLIEIIVVAIIGWVTLKRGLSSLDALVGQAKLIDLESLNRRLSLSKTPSEIRPLVASLNEALERLDDDIKRQRRFLANAAHELRTPVAILTERLNHPEEAGFIGDMKRDARRIRSIVEQLLASARLQGRSEAATSVDLAEVARAAVDDYALLALKNRRHLAFETTPASVVVVGDRQALESIICNLIDNALRAEPEGGTVLVRVDRDATVTVIDHGEGVAAADRELIFEPFWRKTDAKPGAGLGLAIVKELMEAHDGGIILEATPDGGATFKLSFPAADIE
ncbi:HAMP domain-containing sensor histidine kinase [Methylosinus sp. Sm6]|uniref:sensor histidine kinase n=1 Tax=Methylosinus sp. Sm6 TaxID=2866948 RepID=UPI001C99D3CF|nr:HAMP domain-containing sensor histidine kinase [Methylosinus sp. Sm6]MBY6241539.1 HAMP domain-containing histidine kinase [Methylosinus sp. Sm6]